MRYITCPGSADRQLFESGFLRVRATGRPIVLSRQYLAQFGRFRIPAAFWQALGQYACWLDPVIVREWRQLTANRHSATKWGAAASDNAVADRDDAAEGGPATDDAFEWTESRYDTREALERAKQVRDGGYALTCVWSASRIRSRTRKFALTLRRRPLLRLRRAWPRNRQESLAAKERAHVHVP